MQRYNYFPIVIPFNMTNFPRPCHSDDRREEESRVHPLYVLEILRFALNDKQAKSPTKKCETTWKTLKMC